MKKLTSFFLLITCFLLLLFPSVGLAASKNATIPVFYITAVVRNKSVTIYTYNFPKNDNFNVLMNYMGTRGVNGILVDKISSGKGGSFSATFQIPAKFKGLRQIAIRLQSNTGSGYYSYNWFYNNTTGSSGIGNGTISNGSGKYTGIPTFSIKAVVRNSTVTITTNNFPKNDKFKVMMNYMGTKGVNGVVVETISSGKGGSFTRTFSIPAKFKGQYRIAIRLQSATGSGYYAYNWFYNNSTK